MSELETGLVAVVGMAGRFPGARSVRALWRNLCAGVESIEELSDEELDAAGVPAELRAAPGYVPACAFLEHPDRFDAAFFGVTPREAEGMDPQQRVFLEVAWEAFEDAGYDPGRVEGPVGVFCGTGKNHYFVDHLARNRRVLEAMGPVALTIANEKDFVATRVSYKLDLTGPSVSVQTACSTSLVAVHLACQSLLGHECDMALSGGSSISSFRREGYRFVEGGIFSPDGHLRAFDADAAGQVGGNGSAAVVLKRLEDAVADRDTIHAAIRGSAVNNDGREKVSFNAPGALGQSRVVAEALEVADVDPATIGYVECHGTGTNLGDPIEVQGLKEAFRAVGGDGLPVGGCALGSLKSNVGHLDAAAGVSGLIKASLAVEHGLIPASLHFRRPNPELQLEGSPFRVAGERVEWRTDGPRRAGVSSFGMGGTNAHVVLEEPPARTTRAQDAAPRLLVLSARTPAALDEAAARLGARLTEEDAPSLADASWTLQDGRRGHAHRRALVATDAAAAAERLGAGQGSRGTLDQGALEKGREVAFLFSGQGSQYAGMARGLRERFDVFREELDRCLATLEPLVGADLAAWILAEGDAREEADAQLARTQYTQPALFAVEYALARQLEALGLGPAAMLGHSVGEYVAATLAGVLTLDDALRLVAARGRLIGSLPTGDGGGAMLAVPLEEEAVREALAAGRHGELAVAVVNAPALVVVAGPVPALDAFRKDLRARKVAARPLHTSHAFHSPLMDPILAEFEREVRGVRLSPPARRVVSCTTGTWLRPEEATDPGYWVRHLREAVRYADGVRTLAAEGLVLLEVGPGEALAGLARMTEPDATVVATTRHPKQEVDDAERFLEALGALWCAGVAVDWDALRAGEPLCRVPLPTYPFDVDARRFWVEPDEGNAASAARLADPADWTWARTWRRAAGPAPAPVAERALVAGGPAPLAEALERALVERGSTVTRVTRPADAGRWTEVLRRESPALVVDLGALEPAGAELEASFHAPLALARALAESPPAEVRVLLASAGAQDVLSEPVVAERATLLGIVKALNAELGAGGLRACAVDLPLGDDGLAVTAEESARVLTAELDAPEPQVAWRRTGRGSLTRWLPEFERVRLDVVDPSSIPSPHPPRGHTPVDGWRLARLQPEPVILITGGLGGVGLALAEGLHERLGARLVLVGRTALPPRERWNELAASDDERLARRLRALLALEERGAEVVLETADVTDADALGRVVAAARERFGRIDGAIHAAGVPGGRMLALEERASAEDVLGPKVHGLRALEAALSGEPLAFLVLCSSLATAVEGVGQAAYFAANAFLDAYAQGRADEDGVPVASIGWEAWREAGMAAETPVAEHLHAARAESLRLGLSSDEGREVLFRVLGSSLPHVLVSTRDLDERLHAQAEEARRLVAVEDERAGDEATDAASGAGGGHPRPELETPYAEPEGETEARLAATWAELLGIDRVGRADDFFELGGNSLLLLQVSVRLQRDLDVALSMRALFETPTVASLAERVESLRLLQADDGDAAGASVSGETEEFRL